jgi:branched-chain amino acid transport system permease protein
MRTWLKHISPTDIFMWLIGILIAGLVVWGSITTLLSGKYDGRTWIDLLVFGIAQGSIYALIALGYTLVYGILRMINFAHSEVFMVGPFTAYFLADALGKSGFLDRQPIIGLLLVAALSIFISLAVAVTLERVAYRPLRNAPRLVPLITAIGASFFLQYTFRGFYGSGVKTFPQLKIFDGKWNIFGIEVIRTQVVVVIAAVLLMAGLYAFVMLTKTGKAMRAVSEDKATASLMGIDVDGIIATTFAIGGGLAGAAGFLYALTFRQVNFFMGFIPGIKAFTAAVLGGIGNVPGAMVGGLFLGIIESVGPSLFLDGMGIPASYQLKDVIAFTLLVFILIFRPSGILGERLSTAKA